jgi:hypothetical protein
MEKNKIFRNIFRKLAFVKPRFLKKYLIWHMSVESATRLHCNILQYLEHLTLALERRKKVINCVKCVLQVLRGEAMK